MANIKELIQSIESPDSSFDEKLAVINEMQDTLVAMKEHEQEAIDDNVELIIEALRTIEAKVEAKLRIIPEKGEQGIQGQKGEQGDRGLDGAQGKDGKSGVDGKDGLDGKDGVSVQDAKIDFDGSLVITLTDGREINVGEVVPVDVAQTIHKIQSGSGGDSQTTLNAIAALQATIATYGTMATQNKTSVDIEGGTIDNTTIGATTPSTGVFTTLTATGQTSLGGAAGAEGLRVTPLASSTTYINARAGVNGGNAQFGLNGTGNTDFIQYTLGTGAFRFLTNGIGSDQMRITHTASAVNYVQVTGAATGSGPTLSAQGSDTNVNFNVATKGTGSTQISTPTGVGGTAGNSQNIFNILGFSGNTVILRGSLNRHTTGADWTGTGYRLGHVVDTTPMSYIEFNPVGQAQGLSVNVANAQPFQVKTSSGEQLRVSNTASAVNYVQVTGAATGGRVTISSQGSDANVPVVIGTKGSGSLNVRTNDSATTQFAVTSTASAVNYINVTGATTTNAPVLSALGSDTNIPLVLQPKGTGALQAQQTDSTATGGNARGANAVDWQTLRDTSIKVASGLASVVAGGQANYASSFWGVVSGGYNNSNIAFGGTLAGGYQNLTAGNYSVSSGGRFNTSGGSAFMVGSVSVGGISNSSLGTYNFIGGGFTNSGTSSSAVTTQSATMNATTAVTLAASNASIKVGQYISGTSIGDDTYVAAISGTSLTLSKVASGSSTSTLSFFTPHGVVVGGGNNQATGSYSFIGGGGDAGTASNRNVASGDWSFVGGGRGNTASSPSSFVGGGGFDGTSSVLGNTASSNFAAVVCGAGNAATGYGSFIGSGAFNSTSGSYSAILGGASNSANAQASAVLSGYSGIARGIIGYTVFTSSVNPIAATQGASQAALLVLGVQTTDATASVLTCNGNAAGTTNQVILPNNSAYAFRGEIVSGVTGGGNSKSWTIEGLIKRGANAASTTLVGSTVTSMYADAGAVTWTIALSADTTNGGLAVTFTGQAATTIRTVCRLNTTEMTY